jgi:hypothetical protein
MMNQGLLSSPFPDVIEQPVSWGSGKDIKATDQYKAIVNPRNGKVYAVVSRDYQSIRHEEAIERIEEVIAKNSQLGSYKVSTSFYNDGGRMRRKYSFPGISVEISPKDRINLELNLFNSYDMTWPFIVALGAFRLICSNGLIVGQKYFHVRKQHIFQLDRLSIKENFSSAIKRFNLQSEEWKKWSEVLLIPEVYDQVLKSIGFGNKATEEIVEKVSQNAGGTSDNGFPVITLWAFYNVLTWYITHCAVSLNHQVELEKRLRMSTVFLMRNARIRIPCIK